MKRKKTLPFAYTDDIQDNKISGAARNPISVLIEGISRPATNAAVERMREEIRLYDSKHLVSSQSDLVQVMGPLPDGSVFTTVLCDDIHVQAIKFHNVSTCILQLPTPTWIMDELLDGEGRTFRPSYLHSLRKLIRENEDWKSLSHLSVGIEGKSISTDGKSGVHCKIKFKCTAPSCNSRGFFYAEQKNSPFLCARIEGTEYSASIYVYD